MNGYWYEWKKKIIIKSKQKINENLCCRYLQCHSLYLSTTNMETKDSATQFFDCFLFCMYKTLMNLTHLRLKSSSSFSLKCQNHEKSKIILFSLQGKKQFLLCILDTMKFNFSMVTIGTVTWNACLEQIS